MLGHSLWKLIVSPKSVRVLTKKIEGVMGCVLLLRHRLQTACLLSWYFCFQARGVSQEKFVDTDINLYQRKILCAKACLKKHEDMVLKLVQLMSR